MIFSDTLARCREFLEPGTALLLHLDADTREEELRFTGQIIEKLDEAMASKVRELKIHIDATEPVQKLYDVIKDAELGPVKVHLYAYLPDGNIAEMEIKGRYTLPFDMMSRLQKTAGYIKHNES